MTDVTDVVPQLSTKPFSNIFPSLERSRVTTSDLLTLDALDVAKRASIPAREVRRLKEAVIKALRIELSLQPPEDGSFSASAHKRQLLRSQGANVVLQPPSISLLDDKLDQAVGQLPVGHLIEVTGESGAGKTQFLYTLLLAAQLPPPHGLGRCSIYISTEASLQTNRLTQIIDNHPLLAKFQAGSKPSLEKVLSIKCPDLETQDHILRYQLPVALQKHDIGLVVIDSITANYRAEIDRNGARGLAERTLQLHELGKLLRRLAIQDHCLIVVANQVADRFQPTDSGNSGPDSSATSSQLPSSSARSLVDMEDQKSPITLDHQQRWFTGWGNEHVPIDRPTQYKTPSLGLVWTNQISCRIVLLMHGEPSRRRYLKLVFAPWSPDHVGVEFRIGAQGLRAADASAVS